MDEPNIIRIGDDLFDADTGEYAGSALDKWIPDAIENEDGLLAFMRELQQAEYALKAEKERLQAIVRNTERMVRRAQSKVEWMRAKWAEQAIVESEKYLPRKKDGTLASSLYSCPWGKIQRRNVSATVEVTDLDIALAFTREVAPEAVVVTEKILISKLPKHIKESGGDGFAVKPAYVSTTISVVGKEENNEES